MKLRTIVAAAWLLFLLMGAGLAWLGGAFTHSPTDPGAQSGAADGVRIATFNVLYSTDPADLVDTIAAVDADIVALQETREHHQRMFDEALADRYPWRHAALNPRVDNGPMLLSKQPLMNCRYLASDVGYNGAQACEVLDATLVNVHLHPLIGVPGWNKLAGLNTAHRAELDQFEGLWASAPRAVVLGDLNAPGGFAVHEGLTERGFRSVSLALGIDPGAHPTFTKTLGWVPVYSRLDYIYTRGLRATAVRVFEGHPSDHDGVVATVSLGSPVDR